MTMLDRMRRHKGWLKWSLALVVLTFVVFYIPDFITPTAGAAPNEVLAEVQGETITVGDFQRRYTAQLQAYRKAYGSQLSDQLLRQLGIEQQILQQMVDEEAMVAEARRQGIRVSDVEVRERILAIPAFQENGRFIGEQRYRQMLQMNNPPLTTADFEDNLRRALLVEKLRNAVTGWMSVTDGEVADEFGRRNEKVRLDVVPLTPEAFRSQVTVTDAELAAHFESHKETYRTGEKRRLRYALVDVDQVRRPSTNRISRNTRHRNSSRPATSCSGSRTKTKRPSASRPRKSSSAPGLVKTLRRWPSSIQKTSPITPTAARSASSDAALWCRNSSRSLSR
jgi:peptidyl-prolyl cis-trans isomerase D